MQTATTTTATATQEGDARADMLATLRKQLDELLEAQDRLSGMLLGQGFIVECQGLYLDYDIERVRYDIDGVRAVNPRAAMPNRCARFTRLDALSVASATRNGNEIAGTAVHVRDAVHTEIGRLQELIELIEKA